MRTTFTSFVVCFVAATLHVFATGCASAVPASEPGEGGDASQAPSSVDSGAGPIEDPNARSRVALPSAPVDAGPPRPDVSAMLAHAEKEIESLCTLTRSCCRAAGQPTFDMTKCESAYRSYGMQGDLADVDESVLRGGKVAFDRARSDSCHVRIRALACVRIEAATYSSVANQCASTFHGTLRPVGVCRSSLECQAGFFCEHTDPRLLPANQAGTAPYVGRCMPVKPVAASCDRDEECSYRGHGRTCDPVAHRCKAKLALGEACRFGGECTTGLCTGVCAERIDELVTFDDCASFL